MRSGDFLGTLKLLLRWSLIVVVLFLVSSYFLAMLLGPISFFFTEEGLSVSGLYAQQLPIILFTVVTLNVPIWLNVGTLFLLLLAVYTACFIAAWRVNETLHRVVKSDLLNSVKKLSVCYTPDREHATHRSHGHPRPTGSSGGPYW
jgi:hypothetical protein